jgi:hypothetical protein
MNNKKHSKFSQIWQFILNGIYGKPNIKKTNLKVKSISNNTPNNQPMRKNGPQDELFFEYKDKLLLATYRKEDKTEELFKILDTLDEKYSEEAFKVAMRSQSIEICAYYLNNEEEKCQQLFTKNAQFSNYLNLAMLYNSDKIFEYFLQDQRFQNALNDADVIRTVLGRCFELTKECDVEVKTNFLKLLTESNKSCYCIHEAMQVKAEDKILYNLDILKNSETINKLLVTVRYEELDNILPTKEGTKVPKKPKI